MSVYLVALLLLACPLLMWLTMRGGHGHGGHAQSHAGSPVPPRPTTCARRATSSIRRAAARRSCRSAVREA